MDSVFITTRKQRIIRELRDYMLIALGMLMYAIGWTVFLLPNDLPSGAVPGIASIVYWATGLPVQYTYLGINGALLILSLVILGWKFSVKTIYAVFVLSSILPIIQDLTGGESLIHDQPFMACVLGAFFCGGGIGVAFSANGSTGGTDIIAAIVNKYRDITLGRVILMCDLVIISSSYFVLHDWEKVVYGYVVLFVVCCFMLLNIQIEDYTMLQRRTKHDFETYTPVSYVTNKIHSYDAEDGVCVLVVNDQKVIKLSDAKSDTYLYKSGTSLMELCVVKDMEPDLTMGQPLMTCHDFDVEKDVNTISCKINGVTFYVNIRSEVAS